MRKLVLLTATTIVAIFLFLPSQAAASPATLAATAGIPIKLYGDTAIRAPQATVVLSDDATVNGFLVTADSFHVERIHVSSSYATLANGVRTPGDETLTRETVPFSGTRLSLTSRQTDLLLTFDAADAALRTTQAVDDQDPSAVWTEAAAQLSVLLADQTPAPPLTTVGDAPVTTLPAATYAASGRDAHATLADVERILFYGGTLQSQTGETLVSGVATQLAPGVIFANGEWLGPGTHTEETLTYYVLTPTQGAASLEASRLTLYSDDVFVTHDGFVGLPWALGRVETETESHQLRGEQVILGGSLRFRPVDANLDDAPQLSLLGDGILDYVQVGLAVSDNRALDAAVTASSTVAGLGLLAALVYYWPLVKYAAGFLFFPLYARVRKEETLEHKGREVLYELIRNEPGVSTNKLAKEVPFGWSTLTYHLRVLERNEAIVSVRDGRYKRFFDRQSGRYANGRKFVLAVLKNDATFEIARYIRQKPGSSQKEVAGTFQLSPSSVHWHVERLNEVGLVQKIREAHNVKYFPGEGWDHVTVEDLKGLDAPVNAPAAPVGSDPPAGQPSGPVTPGPA